MTESPLQYIIDKEPDPISEEKIIFLFQFPNIQSAFKRHGGGDGMRVQMDIPEQYFDEALELQGLTQCMLKATIEIVEDHRGERNARKTYV